MENDTTILLSEMLKELNFTKYIELAEYFGISPASISGWIERGTTKTALKYAFKKGMDVKNLKDKMAQIKSSSLINEKNENFNSPVETAKNENEDLKKKLDKYKKLDKIEEDFQNFIGEIKKNEEDYTREFKLFCFKKIENTKNKILEILNEYSSSSETKKDLNCNVLSLPATLQNGETIKIELEENVLLDLFAKYNGTQNN